MLPCPCVTTPALAGGATPSTPSTCWPPGVSSWMLPPKLLRMPAPPYIGRDGAAPAQVATETRAANVVELAPARLQFSEKQLARVDAALGRRQRRQRGARAFLATCVAVVLAQPVDQIGAAILLEVGCQIPPDLAGIRIAQRLLARQFGRRPDVIARVAEFGGKPSA
ncbi:hypothetical protein G6F59_014457 [Rhizopus arrhizus]|nr:hypothetical protein G6F59_014457 [Rhizopus arrhizus]